MRKGFTLVEMMVVLVIMGLVIAMVIPTVSRIFYERAESVNQIQTILQRARFLSISNLNEYRVVLDGGNDEVSLDRYTGVAWQTVEGPFELARDTDLQPDITYYVHFYQNGTAGDGSGSAPPQVDIRYKGGAGVKSIRIYSATGFVTVL